MGMDDGAVHQEVFERFLNLSGRVGEPSAAPSGLDWFWVLFRGFRFASPPAGFFCPFGAFSQEEGIFLGIHPFDIVRVRDNNTASGNLSGRGASAAPSGLDWFWFLFRGFRFAPPPAGFFRPFGALLPLLRKN